MPRGGPHSLLRYDPLRFQGNDIDFQPQGLEDIRMGERLHRGRHTVVVRGVDENGTPVVVKAHRGEEVRDAVIERFRREYRIGSRFDHPHIVRYREFRLLSPGAAVLMEDAGGTGLHERLQAGPLDVAMALRVTRAVADALAAVHAAGVLHKDVKPANILITADGGVHLAGFGAAVAVARESTSRTAAEATLAYLAPERTGRMDRPADHRSDLYSLGITLYEALTGVVPFDGEDPLDVVHAHLARPAPDPRELVKAIPEPVALLIDRLLRKDPAERYQSAASLRYDLDAMLDAIDRTGGVLPMDLGTRDLEADLRISDKLYGRAQPLEQLERVFDASKNGRARFVQVTGPAGVGKTALVRRLQGRVVAAHGRFVEGSFDLLQRDAPYRGLLLAFRQLLTEVLSLPDEALNTQRERLEQALAPNAAVLVDVLPELADLLPECPPVPALEGPAARDRFLFVFETFVRTFTSTDHPMVLFLDDLQWADASSLDLVARLLVDARETALLVVTAWRDGEVGSGHPVHGLLDELADLENVVHEVALQPLAVDDVAALLVDSLESESAEVAALADLLHGRSGGNPFLLRLLLRTLAQEGLITPDHDAQRWAWSIRDIRALPLPDDAVGLALKRVAGLPDETRQMLQSVAALGDHAPVRTVASALSCATAEVLQDLAPAIRANVVVPEGEGDDTRIRFMHDRLLEAAYQSLPEADRAPLHRKLGKVLRDELAVKDRAELLFQVTDQLNRGEQVIADASERADLANLNLVAGRRAKRSNAYTPALAYLEMGLRLCDPASELAMDLRLEAAEAAFLATRFERVDELVDDVLVRSGDVFERVRAFGVRINRLCAVGDNLAAVAAAQQSLANLQVILPEQPGLPSIFLELGRTKMAIGRRSAADLVDLPLLEDPLVAAALEVIWASSSAAYFSSPEFLTVSLLRGAALTAKHGLTPRSTYCIAGYSLILAGALKDYDRAYEMSSASLQMIERMDARDVEGRVRFIHHSFVAHWKEPLASAVPQYRAASQACLNGGDIEYLSGNLLFGALYTLLSAVDLADIEGRWAEEAELMARLGQQRNLNDFRLLQQVVSELRSGKTRDNWLSGSYWDADEGIAAAVESGDLMTAGWGHIWRALLRWLDGDAPGASQDLEAAPAFADGMMAQVMLPLMTLLDGLVALQVYPGSRGRKRARKARKQLQAWAAHCTENQAHRVLLLDAELHATAGRAAEASHAYAEAISAAARQRLDLETAICWERAGRFHLSRGDERQALYHLGSAEAAYTRMGADHAAGRVAQVHSAMLGYATVDDAVATSGATDSVSMANGGSTQLIDQTALLRASEAVTEEIHLDRLVEKLTVILVQNAGARRGVLCLPERGELTVHAHAWVTGDDVEVDLTRSPLSQATDVPRSLVQLVARSRNSVLLDDGSASASHGADPYLRDQAPKSALCVPLLRHGSLTGVVYLENSLAARAFTPARAEMVRLLSSQAAISIDNARLFEEVTGLSRAYERFVPKQFLDLLGKESIRDVDLGDHAERSITVLFSDIRSFTSISESMTPGENFRFVNAFLAAMEPAFKAHNGFIDKYIGDAIMGLFPHSPDDALRAAVSMLRRLEVFNQERRSRGLPDVNIGIGIHTGVAMLGTVGGRARMDGTVISDAVNLASRTEGLCKHYGVSLLVTEATLEALEDREAFDMRTLGRVRVKGRQAEVDVLEVLDADDDVMRRSKRATRKRFAEAVRAEIEGRLDDARAAYGAVVAAHPDDPAANAGLQRLSPT